MIGKELFQIHTISCEQVYNVWASEPELLRILDVRSKEEFLSSHIPGAENLKVENLDEAVTALQGRLGIIVAPEELMAELERKYQNNSQVVFLKDCARWDELQYPRASRSFSAVLRSCRLNCDETLIYSLSDENEEGQSYLIADPLSREAALVDPKPENLRQGLKKLSELGLRLMYVLNTGARLLEPREIFEIKIQTQAKTAARLSSKSKEVDIALEDGQELRLGKLKIICMAAPLHGDRGISFYFEGYVFTGKVVLKMILSKEFHEKEKPHG